MEKYSRRERNRAKDFLHKLTTKMIRRKIARKAARKRKNKLTTKMIRELASLEYGMILEDLNRIKERAARKGKTSRELRRRLSKWDARTFQFMLFYKASWFGLPVVFVNPAYSSRTCPVCSAPLKAYRGRLMRCGGCDLVIDRDETSALNLRMRGARGSPERGGATVMMPKGDVCYLWQHLLNPSIEQE